LLSHEEGRRLIGTRVRQRLSAKKLVVAIYPRCIAASGNGARTRPERRVGGLVWAVAYFTFSGYACPIGL
jgi:hypothetical protein